MDEHVNYTICFVDKERKSQIAGYYFLTLSHPAEIGNSCAKTTGSHVALRGISPVWSMLQTQ